jgi:hypothetical protein
MVYRTGNTDIYALRVSLFIILISNRHIHILKRTGEEYAILLKPKPCQEPCQVKHNKCLYLK